MAPIKVATKDWGSAFKGVSDHIAAKSAASINHSTELQNEITNHSGHAFSRHGHQAGWVEQLIRVVTGVTPDQGFAPTGVEAVIREWNAIWVGSDTGEFHKVVSTYDSNGNTLLGASSGSGFTPAGHTTGMGNESGGFFSPEVQMRALDKAKAVINTLGNLAFFEYPVNAAWKPVDKMMVVVDASPSVGYGVGYRKLAGFVPYTRDQVLDLVEGLQTGKTRSQLGFADTGASLTAPNGMALRKEGDRIAFNGVGDLLDHLKVEAFWQKSALVIFKKDGAQWKRITMYPCELSPPGWAPSLKIPGKPWTGKVKLAGNNVPQMRPVPIWRPA